jgi:hypothetical protein
MAAHRVLGLTPGQASQVHKRPRCNESPGVLRSYGFSSTTSSSSMSGERTPISMLVDHVPVVLAHIMLFGSIIALLVFWRGL